MQLTTKPAPPASWQARQRGGRETVTVLDRQDNSSTGGVALAILKRGRWCIIAKLVVASPLDEMVLAMPYRHRQTVNHVSLPPLVLRYAREHGAKLWVVRFDTEGLCYALPLADVEKAGWLRTSEGRPEWFVPLARFDPLPWQTWDYVERVAVLADEADDRPEQLALWG